MSARPCRRWAASLLTAGLLAPVAVAAAPADEIRTMDAPVAAELERVATACAEPEAIAGCQDAIRAWFATHDLRATKWQLDRLIEDLRFDIEVAAILTRLQHADAPAAVQRFRERHEALQSARREATGQREPAPAIDSPIR